MHARLVLVRHGVTAWNEEGRIQGQGGAGLSDDGVEQAKLTAEWLAETFPDAELHSSDLQRCRETVAPLAELLGVDVRFDEGLRERHFGDWQGHTHVEVGERWPDQWARWLDRQDVVGEVGGERNDEVSVRVIGTLRRILDELPDGGTAICVTHGGPVWHGVHDLLGLTSAVLGSPGNASVTAIDDYDGKALLTLWNQVGHLPPHLRTWYRASRGSARDDTSDR